MSMTIKDVARVAGVSVTTVSRFLNHRGYISADTSQRISKAINELNYAPNQLARSLYNDKTHSIGLVIPSIEYPFFSQLTQLMEQRLYQYGYRLLLCTTSNNQERESNILDILRQHRMDGIIMANPSLSDLEYRKLGIPIVALDTIMPSADVSIAANHELGGELAANTLIESGSKYVVQIIGNPEAKTEARERHQIFMRKMLDHYRTCISIPLTKGFYNLSDYASFVESVIETHPNADSFFATDLLALQIEKALLKKSIRIPEDKQIVAYDGTYITDVVHPALTTIRQPFEELAEQAVTSMIHLIEGTPVNRKIILDSIQLVVRDTTKHN